MSLRAQILIYEDSVIVLTTYQMEDVAAHLAGEDEETARGFGWWPQRSTPASVVAAFREWAEDWAHDGPTRTFAVRDRRTRELRGGCQLRRHTSGQWSVSYWTAVHSRRRGVATRALRLLVRFAHDQGISTVDCDVVEDNEASRRVAEAAGFGEPTPGHTQRGPFHGEVPMDGKRRNRIKLTFTSNTLEAVSHTTRVGPTLTD